MHSSRTCTVHCSGHLLPCTTLATHAPCHACPPPLCSHQPHMSPLSTKFLTHACENIIFPQLLLWTVIKQTHTTSCTHNRHSESHRCTTVRHIQLTKYLDLFSYFVNRTILFFFLNLVSPSTSFHWGYLHHG